jgi:hypothetical protein
MTRLPLETRDVRGIEGGPPYELNSICAAPGCDQLSADPHHLWRRSELIGPFWWVALDDETIVGNVVGLCQLHHHAITVNAAWIKWEDGRFVWSDMFRASEPLSFQPPVRSTSNQDSFPVAPEKNGGEAVIVDPPTAPAQLDGVCPSCLRPLPHSHTRSEQKRPRRTWSITVPVDERENGAEMLSTLLEEGRKEMAKAGLPYGDAEAANYFVLSTILALFVQHAEEVLSDD